VPGERWFDGERLRAARQARGFSQEQLAVRSGIAQPSISVFERGRSTPEPPTLLALAQALDLLPADLMVPIDGPPSLARRRVEVGMIQRHVAEAVGIPPSTYAEIETGHSMPSPDLAARLDRFLAHRAADLRKRRK
jgi:transcriptional regulator with XRE-family HTH domain